MKRVRARGTDIAAVRGAVQVVANRADESDDRPGRLVAHQLLMLRKKYRLCGHGGTQDARHRL